MRKINIGAQGFEKLRTRNCFYVDKTDFIREWWEMEDDVTLITRPRRFGKTLNMDTLNCFFSNKYAGRSDLFEGLSIWEHEEYRKLQGTYPVLFITFAKIKETEADTAFARLQDEICSLCQQHAFLLDSDRINEFEKQRFRKMCERIDALTFADSLNFLSRLLCEHYGKKVILLLDEYDTPMQEAYVHGYWEKMAAFLRNLFNAAFKTNPNLERAILTGITRVSRESVFSDLNNLEVVTTTSKKYTTAFGFTQDEVLAALEEYGLLEKMDEVRKWYDGFVFGDIGGIYNPWSITKFVSEGTFDTYWANTSSNGLVGRLIRQGSVATKRMMEELLSGGCVPAVIDEEIVFGQLENKESAIWSLLLAGGYLRIRKVEVCPDNFDTTYYLELTNLEVRIMFQRMFSDWFRQKEVPYGEFLRAMKVGDLREMNLFMNRILQEMVSSFDTAGKPSQQLHPERFYHGLVLGLIATERQYEVRSNGESGYGRYDVIMVPKVSAEGLPCFVIEFKLFNPDAPDYEKTLEDTVARALKQIRDKAYDTAILARGIPKEQIRHYGFGFRGKKVLIGEDVQGEIV